MKKIQINKNLLLINFFCESEMRKIVLLYNPTRVCDTRVDGSISASENWNNYEKAQIVLYASLLHYPTDSEVPHFLIELAQSQKENTVLREAIAPIFVSFFVREFLSAPEDVQIALVNMLKTNFA